MGLIDGGFLFIRASLFSSFSTPRETNGTEIILNLNGLHALVITFLQGVFRYRQMSHDQYFKMQINDISFFFPYFIFPVRCPGYCFFRGNVPILFSTSNHKKRKPKYTGVPTKKNLFVICCFLALFYRRFPVAATTLLCAHLTVN